MIETTLKLNEKKEKESQVYEDVSELVLHFSDGRKQVVSNGDDAFRVTVSPQMVRNEGFVELILYHHSSCATVEELSARCGYNSTRTFTRHFHKHFRTTPKQWLMSVKKREVIHLLRNTKIPLVVIASRLGFTDASHLHNFCLRRTGKTPSEIRRETVR